jgi:hypothetical protein
MGCAIATILLAIAHIINPSVSLLLVALTACAGTAATLLYSILVDKAQKALTAHLKKL